jgi:hypothetical protein
LGVKSIVYFSDWHIPVHHVLLGILGVAIIVSLIYRIQRREWLRTSDSFLLIAVLFTIMFIKAPWGIEPGGGGWINDRIHLYILLMLAPWLAPDMGKILRFSFTGALVAICLLHLGRSTYDQARLNREIAELTSGVHLMEPHTAYSVRGSDWRKSEALGQIEYVKPFVHAKAFYGLANQDIGYLANYEANYDYFPIDYNNRNVVSDYVVAWAYPEEEKFADLTPNYDLIHQTRNLKLFRIKGAEGPDLSVWSRTPDGQLIIRFDMQPNEGVTAEGQHPIGFDANYVSGKFGWVTKSPHHEFQGAADIPPRYRDNLWDTEDAAFKLDLPNSTYRVTHYFCSAEDAAHEVNLLANGKQVINKLIVPKGNKTIKCAYTLTVTQGHLTQVIYTPRIRAPRKEKHNHWVWNGFTVEQLSVKDKAL